MKIIHKLFLGLLLSLLAMSIHAQESRFTFGAEIGGNFSNTTYDRFEATRSPKLGYSIGATAEYSLKNNFYIQSGLALTTKGAKHKHYEFWEEPNSPTAVVRRTINQMYLQVPIMVAYKVDITPNTKFFINTGAYIAYGIGGKDTTKKKTKDFYPPEKTVKESTFGSKRVKRFDYGLGGGVGIEFQQYVIGLHYELGLRDIIYKDDNLTEKYDYKNRNASLTLGYRF